MRTLVASILAAAAVALIPTLVEAHSLAGQRAEFTPAPDSLSFADVMRECVQAIDPAQTQLQSGLGDAKYPLVTLGLHVEQVKLFYSQGFTLQYGFNFPDAIQAFHKAISLDQGVAMPYWGIALSANSNINSDATHGCNRLSYRASQVALRNAQARLKDPAARAQYSIAQLEREVGYADAFASLFERSGTKVVITDATQRRYVERMKALSERYEDDLDAATLYADALLNVTPWKWWKGTASTSNEVKPTPEADTALQVLNKVLMQNALHSGANHFYIHVIEESPFSESGQPMAERLPRLTPASGHLVHMASHIYQRIGDNAAASAANYAAVSVDRALANQDKSNDVYPLHYLGHNIHFLTWTLSIEGRRNESLNMAEELVQNTRTFASNDYLCRQFPEEIQVKSDYFFAAPFYFGTRFQAWDYVERMAGEVKAANEAINQTCRAARPDWPELKMPYSRAMLAYARAYQALGGPGEAGQAALRDFWGTVRAVLDANKNLQYGNNAALQLFRIADVILLDRALNGGRSPAIPLETLRQQLNEAVGGSPAEPLAQDLADAKGDAEAVVLQLWRKGVVLQDALNYNEPPDWYYTLRESLGYALLSRGSGLQGRSRESQAQGKTAQAQREADEAQAYLGESERVFLADLKNNRQSGRSLAGLKLSLEAQKKSVPEWVKSQLAAAWRNATVSAIPAP
ncbi:hypothetical protein [Chitinimonas koreensis]|uniref:hypothetical protein n=1 Tax=Chitinimonas koreensis TaxID=356302 RepID=UPI00041C9879|nr:hypothetical protein [Chitinimonas koreensis]QNM97070.1 hypothetical protein H9L41_01665 [Chitinimonas koreensis]